MTAAAPRYRREVRATSIGPGTVVADRRLVTLLGSGGEGEVWEAARPDHSRCALKLIKPEVLPAPEEVRRRGAWLVHIDHPALVRVSRGGRFTGGTLAGWGFVEMDLIDGPSLQDAGPLPDALERLAGVAEALDLLHAGAWSQGVPLVHRDIKPGNLIAAGEGLVLVDPSTMRGLDTQDLTRVGTPAYLAPEVGTGRFGPLADVYSLAATAAALLTGRRGAALSRVVADPWAYGLPRSVCEALAPDPVHRPATCAYVVGGGGSGAVAAGLGVAEYLTAPAADPPIATGPRWALPAFAVLALVPAVVWSVARTRPSLLSSEAVVTTGIGAGLVHLAIHVFTGRGMLALFAPPWAWGDLLADRRARPGKRTAWLADVSAGTVLVGMAGVALSLWSAQPAQVVPATVAVTVLLLAVWRRLARVSGRLRWAPVWLLSLPFLTLAAVPRLLISGQR